jgi:hypothetical protein
MTIRVNKLDIVLTYLLSSCWKTSREVDCSGTKICQSAPRLLWLSLAWVRGARVALACITFGS